MRILEPIAIAATPTIGGSAGAGTGAANLLTPSPREVYLAGAVGYSTIDIDLGAAQAVQGFWLGSTNATAAATWVIQKGTSLGGGLADIKADGAFRAADSLGPVHHGFAVLPAPVTSRYFRILVTQTGADPLLIGSLLVGNVFQAPYEFGGGRLPIDTSAIEELTDGGFGIGRGVVKSGYRWTFGDLTPAQRHGLWRLVYERGASAPTVVDEETGETDQRNEELHYGLFERFEPYARSSPGRTRWALSMREWR